MTVISLLTDLAGNTPVLNSNLGNYPYARIKTLFFSLCLFSPEIGDLSSKQPNQVNGKACLLACARVSVFGDPRNPLRQSCLTIPAWWLSKESACVAGDEGLIPGGEDPLEKEMATHSSVLAWKIPWTAEPGRPQSMGSQRVGHD